MSSCAVQVSSSDVCNSDIHGTYVRAGTAASGAPYFKHSLRSYFIYWDESCDGINQTPKWIIDNSEPSTTATSNLDGEADCVVLAYYDSTDNAFPPTSARCFAIPRGQPHFWLRALCVEKVAIAMRAGAANCVTHLVKPAMVLGAMIA